MKVNVFVLLLGSAFLFSTVAPVHAVDVLRTPPIGTVTNAPKLSVLLQDANFRAVTTKRHWEIERERIKENWFRYMGELPKERPPLKPVKGELETFDTYHRQYVRYDAGNGMVTDGYLLRPKEMKSSSPAVVVFHPTTEFHAKGVAGLEPSYPEEKRQGIHLVQRGYVVWCPRNFIFDEVAGIRSGEKLYLQNVQKLHDTHPVWTPMTRMTYDAIRSVDFLETLSFVDKENIGCLGHSLGGKVAIFAGAFDPRYKAVVSSEGGIGLNFSNWDAPWYLGKGIKEPNFALDNHQLLASMAPRPFLLLAGGSADNDRSWSYIRAAMSVYRVYGKESNIGWFNHHQGHTYNSKARAVAEEFLDKHLKN